MLSVLDSDYNKDNEVSDNGGVRNKIGKERPCTIEKLFKLFKQLTSIGKNERII